MRRIEGQRHALTDLQMLSAAIGVLALQIPAALWLAISYRDGIDESVVVTLNDVWRFTVKAITAEVPGVR